MGEEKSVLLTQEAFDTLKDELAHRQGQYREEITKRIAAARAEGDLSENGGYQAAREEQAKNEGRINELTVKLRNATIVKAKEAGEDVDALRAKLAAEYERTTVNANLSLEMGEIDAMIDPEQTRQAIAESLRLLADKKRVRRTTKHHGNQPL